MSNRYVDAAALLLGVAWLAGSLIGTGQETVHKKGMETQRLQPLWIIQLRPAGQLLAQVREALRQVGGKEAGAQLVEQFNEGLKKKLGDRGLSGLDLDRPWGGFGLLDPKELEKPPIVLVLPISEEKAFLDLLQRLGIQSKSVAGQPGAYNLQSAVEDLLPAKAHLRVVPGGWAYVIVNVATPWDETKLPRPEELWKERPEAIGSVRIYPQRVPAASAEELIKRFEDSIGTLRGLMGGDGAPEILIRTIVTEALPRWFVRNLRLVFQQGEEIEGQFRWEMQEPSAVVVMEWTLRPKPDSELARSIAQRGESLQRFAGLARVEKAALTLTFQPPQFTEELRTGWSKFLELGQKELKDAMLPTEVAAVLQNVLHGWQKDVLAGEWEVGLLLREPNAQGHYSLGLAISCSNARDVEGSLRKLAATKPFEQFLQLDAAKTDTMSVHRLKVWQLLPAEVRDYGERLFGESPTLFIACGRDALYAAIGPEASVVLQQVARLRRGSGAAVELHYQPKQLATIATIVSGDEDVGDHFRQFLGTESRLLPAVRLQVDGGQQLRYTLRLQDRLAFTLLRGFFVLQ